MERDAHSGRGARARVPAVALLAVVVALGAWLARGGIVEGEAPPAVPAEEATVGGPEAPLGSWRSLPDPPVAWAGPLRAVWTGAEALVWGRRRDGTALLLAYDPGADRWRVAATPPIGGRVLAVVAWTGPGEHPGHTPELVVWGGLGGDGHGPLADGAAYDPATDRWRLLPAAPIGPRAAAAAAWTGSEVVIAGGAGERARRHDGAAYDPLGDRWRPLGGLSRAGRIVGHARTADRRLALVAAGGGQLRLLRYNHDHDRWREESLPLASGGNRALVAAGGRLVLWGGAGEDGAAGLVWDGPGETRRLTSAGPAPRGLHAAAWTGTRVVVWGGQDRSGALRADGAALDPLTGEWAALAPSPLSGRILPGSAWTGEELLVVGGTDGEGAAPGGAAWRP